MYFMTEIVVFFVSGATPLHCPKPQDEEEEYIEEAAVT
jgi:hypothetical protein